MCTTCAAGAGTHLDGGGGQGSSRRQWLGAGDSAGCSTTCGPDVRGVRLVPPRGGRSGGGPVAERQKITLPRSGARSRATSRAAPGAWPRAGVLVPRCRARRSARALHRADKEHARACRAISFPGGSSTSATRTRARPPLRKRARRSAGRAACRGAAPSTTADLRTGFVDHPGGGGESTRSRSRRQVVTRGASPAEIAALPSCRLPNSVIPQTFASRCASAREYVRALLYTVQGQVCGRGPRAY